MQDNEANPEDQQDYDVGYGKPPKSGQFKPGQSGNRKGRPKTAKNMKTLVNEVLAERVSIKDGGKEKRVSKSEALVRKTCSQAMKGDARARDFIAGHHSPEDTETQNDIALSEIELADVQEFARRTGLVVNEQPQADLHMEAEEENLESEPGPSGDDDRSEQAEIDDNPQ